MRFKLLYLTAVVILASTLAIAEQATHASDQTSNQKGTMCIPTGTWKIKAPESVDMKLAPVDFPHSLHFEFSCKRCHHKWNGNTEIKNCMAAGCHDVAAAPEKPLKDGVYTEEAKKYYKYAYHESCRPCHKGVIEEAMSSKKIKDSGPTGCTECHPEESKH